MYLNLFLRVSLTPPLAKRKKTKQKSVAFDKVSTPTMNVEIMLPKILVLFYHFNVKKGCKNNVKPYLLKKSVEKS